MMRILISSIHTIWKIFWRSGLFVFAWGMLLVLFFVPFGPKLAMWEKTAPTDARLCADIASTVTILTASWIMTRFIDHRPFLSIGLTTDHIFKDFLTGLVVGSAWLGVSVSIAWAFGWVSPRVPVGFSWSLLAGSSIAMLFNVFTQELILCGFIFQTIRSKSNVVTAMIVSSILFSSLHAGAFKGEWLPVVNVFAAGLLFCLAYVITGNLWFPISIHFAWDVLLGPVFGLTESGIRDLGGGWKMFVVKGPQLFTGGAFGLEGGFIVTLTAFIALVLMYLFQRKNIHSESNN